ncbi:MAG: adenine-specific DNA-methyltransferase [Blastocatellia bacterium]|jgi:hypothetical protein|nr:adenine-specific DNA-methyltransferase [Blastocatellia bacterium]
MEWNPKRPDAWAQLFGLVVVPMFGHDRTHHKGVHSLMLDGSRGSFVLSTSGPKSIVTGRTPVQWAWSANVNHAVSIAGANGQIAIVRRWDSPDEAEEWDVGREKEARALFRALEKAPQPPDAQSVIARGLNTFRAIRIAIEKQGGSSLDVVLAFNTVLAWVAQKSASSSNIEVSFAEAVDIVRATGKISFTTQQINPQLRSFPIGYLARLLREGDKESSTYLLDADLLIRHASGPLYQEAHRQLLSTPASVRQEEMFPREMLISGREGRRALVPTFVHHTPPSLARALVESTLRWLEIDPNTEFLEILDPASGSGIFLIEALRELGLQNRTPYVGHLKAFDQSQLATAMADFCLRNAAPSDQFTVTISPQNSLEENDWGSPHVIAMNPPFLKWEDLDTHDRDLVRQSLGPLHKGRPDLAFAFIVRALKSLRQGGVLATLMPPSFLDGESAELIRNYILQSGEFQVRLIGHFRDLDYFDATIEPSFIVVSRSTHAMPIVVVTAKRGSANEAIRALRSRKQIRRAGFEISTVTKDDLLSNRWTPQPERTSRFVDTIKSSEANTVDDFFVLHTGIRTGNNSVFRILENDAGRLTPSTKERRFFRPVANRIEKGRILPAGYVFYPYDSSGTLLLKTEEELKTLLPRYYEERLRPAKSILRERKSLYRNWWELSEPRVTWLAAPVPRILSKAFGRAADFAYDREGKYAVVQGVAWSWKAGNPTDELMLAYLALINSRVFDELISCFCPRIRGGQYELGYRFMKRVPLPQLSDHTARKFLSAIGRAITNNRTFDSNAQDELVLRAYRLSLDDLKQIGRTPLEKRIAEIGELPDGWFEPNSPHLERSGLRKFEKFLKRVLAGGGLPTPYVYPTPEGDAQAEWSLPTWEVSASVTLASGELHLHATHLDSDLSRDVETTIDSPGSVDTLIDFMSDLIQ